MDLAFASLLLVLVPLIGVAADSAQQARRDLAFLYKECPTHADSQDCPVPDYTPCPVGQLSCGTKKRHVLEEDSEGQRRLQVPTQPQVDFDDDTNLPYGSPCFSPSRNTLKSLWTKWEAADDAAVNVGLSFPFDFYGQTYNDVLVVDNGFIGFDSAFQNNHQPTSFPSGLYSPIIAPFWADVQTANNGGRGDIYYRDFGNEFAVIWDEVGYYKDGNIASPTHNSFQLVISKTANPRMPDSSNICFCYLDMGWTHGDKDGVNGFGIPNPGAGRVRAATVGISRGLDDPFATTNYVQIGRFNETGDTYRGVALNSGVDWLDWLGSNKPQQLNHRKEGFCFNGNLLSQRSGPVAKAFPVNGTITIPCDGVLDQYSMYFVTPELEQTLNLISLVSPNPFPDGLQMVFDGGGFASDTLGIRFEWLNIDFVAYYGGQSFDFQFEVCDDHAQTPLCNTEFISIMVSSCVPPPTMVPPPVAPIATLPVPTTSAPAAMPQQTDAPDESPEQVVAQSTTPAPFDPKPAPFLQERAAALTTNDTTTTTCPILDCCDAECCGNGTSWSGVDCIANLTSFGWNGEFDDLYEEGCAYRKCCEGGCCTPGTTVWDITTSYCIAIRSISGNVTEEDTNS